LRRVDKRDEDDWEWLIKDKFNNKDVLDRRKVEEIIPSRFHR